MIYINVVNQKLSLASTCDWLVSGSQKFVKFKFNLEDDWDNLSPFAQFQQNGKAYNQYLDDDNCAFLPPEIGAGSCTLILYGSGDTVIATTNFLTFKVNKNNLISDAQSTEITQSLYDQLIDRVNEVTSLTRGEPGEDGFSPTVAIEKIGEGTSVDITDRDGVHNFIIPDGAKGDKGDRGDKGDAGQQGERGDKGATGEQGVSITGSTIDESGHLILNLSDNTTIDAGVLPVSSVNGKTGVIELSASDIGAPTDAEFDTVSVLSGLDSLFSTSASAMFGTSGMDINIGLSTQQPIYICLSASSGLSAGASITATPYWGGTSMQTAYAAIGMKLNRWYKIGHPMVGATVALPKINVKTDTGSMMTSSMNVFIRYFGVPGDTIDLTVAADAVACNAFVEKEVTSITTTNTPVVVSDAPSVSKAYIYLRYPGTPATPQIVTATPVYSGAEYSAGVVSNMKLNRWYALGVPADGAALSAVKLKVNTGTISSVTAVIRYDGNIDGNGVSY